MTTTFSESRCSPRSTWVLNMKYNGWMNNEDNCVRKHKTMRDFEIGLHQGAARQTERRLPIIRPNNEPTLSEIEFGHEGLCPPPPSP